MTDKQVRRQQRLDLRLEDMAVQEYMVVQVIDRFELAERSWTTVMWTVLVRVQPAKLLVLEVLAQGRSALCRMAAMESEVATVLWLRDSRLAAPVLMRPCSP